MERCVFLAEFDDMLMLVNEGRPKYVNLADRLEAMIHKGVLGGRHAVGAGDRRRA